MNVCTIIAKNYVAHARVLARSLADTHPGSRLWTLIIDETAGYIDPEREPFEVLTPSQVGCDEFLFMATRYSILELSTAVKPWLLRYLMERLGGPVTYLDPDIKVFGSLVHLDELAAEHGLVLTPHNLRPIPQDGRRPSQVDVMIAGVYNLGYVTLAPGAESDALLDWWAERLRRDCRVDPMWGYFVDQRWFDLAPGFASDVAILRDPEYNIAYWNLQERALTTDGESWRVDGRPLRFFHFSGFDPANPGLLSRHQDRIDVAGHPALARLLEQYSADVLSQGHAETRHWPYTFAALGDGSALDDRTRAYIDEFVDVHAGAVASPFTVEGMSAFDRWLSSPEPGAPLGVTRALARVWEERPDVRGAFPRLDGPDLPGLLAWARDEGATDDSILARALAAAPTEAPPAGTSAITGEPQPVSPSVPAPEPPPLTGAQLRGAPWGVNVVSTFDDGPGSELARGLIASLDAAGIRALPVGVAKPVPGTADAADAVFAVNLICLDPRLSLEPVTATGSALFAGRYSIGVWAWPADLIPDSWAAKFELLDELWSPRRDTLEDLSRALPIPVNELPIAVGYATPRARPRAALGLPAGGTLFYTRCDLRGVAEDETALGAIEAFRRAFAVDGTAVLALDCVNADSDPAAYTRIAQAAAAHGDVFVSRERTPDERRSTLAASDCVVSLHRVTAFGETLAEGLALGKHVIATGYAGNLAYMTEGVGTLVACEVRTVGEGHEPLPPQAHWAQPDLDDAARLLAEFAAGDLTPAATAATAAAAVRDTHSPERVGEELGRRLERIRVVGRAKRPADPLDGLIDVAPTLARLPRELAAGPTDAAPGRARQARERLRQAVLRIMRPYTAFQSSVNSSMVAAILEVEREVERARDRGLSDRAEMLAALRRADTHIDRLAGPDNELEFIKRTILEQTNRDQFLALAELRRRHAEVGTEPTSLPAVVALAGHELRVFSQNGEDGVLAEILRRVGARQRWFVEFGIESGREGNCVHLADVEGWSGLFMEADDEMFSRLEAKYCATERIVTVQAMVGPENVEALFDQAGVPEEPDVVSIDVDGQDYWIWGAITRYRPRVVVCEYNAALDPRSRLVQPLEADAAWRGGDYYGASLGALAQLGERQGYRLVHTELSAVNAFFVREDLAGAAFPAGGEVAVRGTPNYYGRGLRHPPATGPGRYLDLDSGRLVAVRSSDGRR